ncbi:unnamed protein product [Calypogeia fissa]
MAKWDNVDSDKQEEKMIHNLSSSGVSIGSNHRSSPQCRPAPSRTWSDTAHRSKRRRLCLVFVIVAAVLIIALVCAIAIPIAVMKKSNSDNGNSTSSNNNAQPITTACQTTLYPQVCIDSLSNRTSGNANPMQMVKLSIQAATDSVTQELNHAQALALNTSSPQLKAVYQDCIEFIQASLDSIGQTLDGLNSFNIVNLDDNLADLETWMSASLTTQQTCLDDFQDLDSTTLSDPEVADFVQEGNYCSMLLSNVLAFVSALQNLAGDIPQIPNIPGHRRLLTSNDEAKYVTFLKRRLMGTNTSTTNANLVVAQDGSGNYNRIQDAVNQAAQKGTTGSSQFVIYIKAGKYVETVVVPKNLNNLVFLGDGVGKTIISGSLSVIGSNVTTSATATLTVNGKNFVGRSFTVENTAGAANHQAVALRVAGDYAAFEMCQFLGFQDTLYVHTNRQFYLSCTILGTVDFIFGNAAVVFQSSQILATIGLAGQQNTYTASGRTDPNQNTGITFQSCTFDGTASLKSSMVNGAFMTYLGRPWKNYARTVVMQSVESSVLAPAGWLDWQGVTPNSTVYYAEYQNTGPGSLATSRVSWSQQIGASQALKFTVDSFIQGKNWLPQANVTYMSSL